MIEASETVGTFTAYIDNNHPQDAPVLTVVKHIQGTTSIVFPRTLGDGDLSNAKPEADSALDSNGYQRLADWKMGTSTGWSQPVEAIELGLSPGLSARRSSANTSAGVLN